MELIPQYWPALQTDMNVQITWKECVIASFRSSLRLDLKVEPDTCFNYITAARFELSLHNINTDFIDHSPYIKLTKTSLTALFRADEENRVANRVTQPFTVDMILRADEYFFSSETRQKIIV